jgi:enediyne biosynthesis protein E4
VWVDYNIDGRVDLLVDNSGFPPYSRLVLFEQDETKAFINLGSQLGIDIVNPTGTITLDVNRDGLPDILTSQNNIRKADIPPRLYFFQNNQKLIGKRAVKVHLNGIKSNTEAIGAMVMLYTQTKSKKIVQRRWVEYTQGGLPSQNEEGVLFGVSEGVEVVGVKVRWPFVQKSGFGQGNVIEKLYSLKGYQEKDLIEITVCEDGKVLSGKMGCQF